MDSNVFLKLRKNTSHEAFIIRFYNSRERGQQLGHTGMIFEESKLPFGETKVDRANDFGVNN